MKTVLYDVKICKGINELKRFIEYINEQKHKIISVTQRDVCYTIVYEYFGNE